MQRRIQEELDSKVGGDRSPQLSDRGSLPYLEATIREVLRIRPVAPLLIPHVALSDTRYTRLCHDTHSRPFTVIHPCQDGMFSIFLSCTEKNFKPANIKSERTPISVTSLLCLYASL